MYSTKDDDAGSQNLCVLKCMIKHSKWLLFSFKMITEQDFCSSVLRSHPLLTEAEITIPCFILTWEKSH